jgi:hypothetical protein
VFQRQVLEDFDAFLASRSLRLEAIAIGRGTLVDLLPPGWQARLQPVFMGQAIMLHTLGRADLLETKLLALCDRGTDLVDCIALGTSAAELEEASPWVCEQDAHEQWPAHGRAVFAGLASRLNHAV